MISFAEFMEMARVRNDDKFYLSNDVISYLKHFVQESKTPTKENFIPMWGISIDLDWTFRWFRGALMKLFDNKILNSENPPNELTIKVGTSDKKTATFAKTFSNIPINISELKDDLESKNIDVSKMQMGRQMAGTTALKTINWLLGKTTERPYISAKEYQKDYKSPEERGYGHQYSHKFFAPPEKQLSPAKRKNPLEITLDDNDLKFIRYFQTQNLPNATNSSSKPGSTFLRQALMWRYSPKLIRDIQSQQSKYGGNVGEYYDLIFPWRLQEFIAKKVPVNAMELRNKLDNMAKNGRDLYANPLSPSVAMRLLSRSGFKDYSQSTLSGQSAFKI